MEAEMLNEIKAHVEALGKKTGKFGMPLLIVGIRRESASQMKFLAK
jgi:hypothetical protein